MSYNPWGDALDDVKYLQLFNESAVYPAPGAPHFERDSAPYKQNIEATRKVSKAFNAAVQDPSAPPSYPISYAGLFWSGVNEIAVHKDDAPAVLKILDGLKEQGLIERVQEIPKEQSWHYAMTKAKFTPH